MKGKYLRNLKVGGAALVAVLMFSALATASASAAKPEFKSPGGFPVKFTATSGAGKLETAGVDGVHRTVTCKSDTASGEITGAKTAKAIVVVFKECSAVESGITFNCGTITTNKLTAEPNYLTNPAVAGEVGLDLKPEAGNEFAKFTCTAGFLSETLTVTGSVVGKITPTNKLTKTYALTFAQTAGKQRYEGYFVGATFTKDILETAGAGAHIFGPEQSAIEGTESITTEKEVELSA